MWRGEKIIYHVENGVVWEIGQVYIRSYLRGAQIPLKESRTIIFYFVSETCRNSTGASRFRRERTMNRSRQD
jgi:hypothetical protein